MSQVFARCHFVTFVCLCVCLPAVILSHSYSFNGRGRSCYGSDGKSSRFLCPFFDFSQSTQEHVTRHTSHVTRHTSHDVIISRALSIAHHTSPYSAEATSRGAQATCTTASSGTTCDTAPPSNCPFQPNPTPPPLQHSIFLNFIPDSTVFCYRSIANFSDSDSDTLCDTVTPRADTRGSRASAWRARGSTAAALNGRCATRKSLRRRRCLPTMTCTR